MTASDRPFDVLSYDDRDEWLEIRGRGIGGSDVAALMGLSAYKSPLRLWLEKTGRVEPEDLSGKESVSWGVTLEPVIREKFAANHPELTVQLPSGVYINSECPWERASLDAELYDKASGRFGVLEIKTAGERMADDWKGGVPVYYQTQVTHYLNVTGYSFAWVAVLIGGQKYREYRFWPDDDDRKAVRDAVRSFWGFVQRDEPPALVGHADESATLTAYHENDNGDVRQESPALDEIVSQYRDVCDQIKALEVERRTLGNTIKERVGDSHGFTTDVYKVLWLRNTRTDTDLKAFEADHPGMLDAYRRSRVVDGGLRVSEGV